jgi:hypothetical protein
MNWQAWLNEGCDALGMEAGAINVRCGRHLTVIHSADKYPWLCSGDSFDIRGTFCEQAMQSRGLITHNQQAAGESYRIGNIEVVTSLNAYIGYALVVRDTVFGTLSFSSTHHKLNGFSVDDSKLIELMAKEYIQYNLMPDQTRR